MMKLKLKKNEKNVHQDFVSSVCWAPNNQLFSMSDDKTIQTWDINGDYQAKFLELDNYYTAMEWGPNLKSNNESLALGTSDGQLKIMSKSGKIEKVINDAHSTAVSSVFLHLRRLFALSGRMMVML